LRSTTSACLCALAQGTADATTDGSADLLSDKGDRDSRTTNALSHFLASPLHGVGVVSRESDGAISRLSTQLCSLLSRLSSHLLGTSLEVLDMMRRCV
jgi:hypothetical protein